jgi:Uma2 family endonuclease
MERFLAVGDVTNHFPGPPDLAVEVLSPHNRPGDVHAKVADFLVAGTRLVWTVDPSAARVSVYRTLLSPRILASDDLLEGGDVLPGFSVRVADLFSI